MGKVSQTVLTKLYSLNSDTEVTTWYN